MRSIANILEVIMLLCFGASWPINLRKAIKARTAKGTSLPFFVLIEVGYFCGIMAKVINNYPLWATGGKKLTTTPYQGTQKTRTISWSNSRYSLGSSQKPDSLRSEDISMAHLTEVGLWKATAGRKPEDLVEMEMLYLILQDCTNQ